MSFIGAAVVGGVGTIAGAAINSSAAGSAADKQLQASREANALQEKMYNQTRADQEPWRQAGGQALSQMQDPSFQHTFGRGDFQQDPGYQFRMDEGQKALERSAAARGGGLDSGAALKELTQYGQNFASNEYQNAYNRFNNDQSTRFNRLSSIAGVGQTANNVLGAAGQNYAGQVGNNLTSAAGAAGKAEMAQANAWGSALSGIGKGVSDYGAMNQNRTWMNQWMSNRGGA